MNRRQRNMARSADRVLERKNVAYPFYWAIRRWVRRHK